MAKYRNDPRWIEAKFAGKCSGIDGAGDTCTQAIKRGDRVFYYPGSRTVLAQACGHADAAARDFESHRQDEEGF